MRLSILIHCLTISACVAGAEISRGFGIEKKTCTIQSSSSNETDDAPAILQAFRECGIGGKVVFLPTTYHVNSVMNVTWLKDAEIDIQGTLLVRLPKMSLRVYGFDTY
jgi:hypothetical protein